MNPSPTIELLKPSEIAKIRGISEKTLANWRSARVGPPVLRVRGVLLYPKSAFEQWIIDNTEAMDGTQAKGRKVALRVHRRPARVDRQHRLGGHRTQRELRLAKLEGRPESSILPLRRSGSRDKEPE